MAGSETVEFRGTIKDYRYRDENTGFTIATMRVKEVLNGKLHANKYGDVVFKGNFDLLKTTNYVVKGEYVENEKFGDQYNFIYSKRENPVEDMEADDFARLLLELSPTLGLKINNEYDDAREIFEKHDLTALTKIKGIGVKGAEKMFDKYESQKDFGPAYVEFGKWGFTMAATRKIVRAKGGVDAAVKTLKKNPYDFMGINGIGFKTIDKKATEMGVSANDPRRVHAFIKDYFEKSEMAGSSWTTPTDLSKKLRKEVFNCDLKETMNWIKSDDAFVVYQVEGKEWRVATTKIFNSEKAVAKHLLRLKDGEKGDLKDVPETIKRTEKQQGFEYSRSQLAGIKKMADNKVVLLRGVAGSGKSSTINAVVKIFKKNGLSIASCALSGKAADNLSQIAGLRGMTIHRLLGMEPEGKARFNEQNQLPFDVVILDEVSMVDIKLFKRLVEALRDNARLIMVGDSAQLDSIGVGVMRDLVDANIIPVVTLTEIHRQAKESAIITHSLTYRMGKMPEVDESKSWKMFGAKRDLGYVFERADEENNLLSDCYRIFKSLLAEGKTLQDIQIVTPMTTTCLEINKAAQKLANPGGDGKEQYEVYPGKDYGYVLREGDKVLNTANNYRTVSAKNESEIMPIFNGNTGTIEKITVEYDKKGKVANAEMVVNFDGVGHVLVPEKEIKHIQLGYAMTVHKSQGSTIPNVIVVLPFQFMLNSRELLYTAMTRSSEKCFILTSMRTLKSTVKKTSETIHRSNLSEMLRKVDMKVGE